MAFEIDVDHEKHRIHCRLFGDVTEELIAEYQLAKRDQPQIIEYDEILDLRHVEHLHLTANDIDRIVHRAIEMPTDTEPGRLAIVASTAIAYGMSRMFQAKREMSQERGREREVFSELNAAISWLDEGVHNSRCGAP